MDVSADGFSRVLIGHLAELSLVILVVGGLARWVGPRRPHWAHALWALVILRCLLPPGLTSPLGLLPGPPWSNAEEIAEPPREAAVEAEDLARPFAVGEQDKNVGSGPRDVAVEERPSLGKIPSVASVPGSMTFPLSLLICAVWVVGVLYQVGRTWVFWRRARMAWRSGFGTVPSGLQDVFGRLCETLRWRRPVRLMVDPENYGPLVMGLFRPRIVLPQFVVDRSPPRDVEWILAHEIVHLRRGDVLWSLMQWLAQALWWFHPLVGWANRQWSLVSEICCDEAVVATLACPPRDYARCLLRIAEERSRFRSIPGVPAYDSSKVTKTRLRSLIQPSRPYAARTPWWAVIGAVALAPMLFPSSRPFAGAQSNDVALSDAPLSDQARQAFAAQRWPDAIRLYRMLLEKEPNRPLYWSNLGYALHVSGQLDEAIEAHRRASTFPQTRAGSFYNLACAYSLKNRSSETLEFLARAIDAGYRSPTPLDQDPDLASLRENDRFRELAGLAYRGQAPGYYGQLDFWIGRWTVESAAGEPIGSATITKDESGHLITEKWKSFGQETGTGISFFDPAAKKWKQTWVESNGAVSTYEGSMKNGEMLFEGETVFASGRKVKSTSGLRAIDGGTVALVMRQSTDGGSTWEEVFRGTYVPEASDEGETVPPETVIKP